MGVSCTVKAVVPTISTSAPAAPYTLPAEGAEILSLCASAHYLVTKVMPAPVSIIMLPLEGFGEELAGVDSHLEPAGEPIGVMATWMCGCCLVEAVSAPGARSAECMRPAAFLTCFNTQAPGRKELLVGLPDVAAPATTRGTPCSTSSATFTTAVAMRAWYSPCTTAVVSMLVGR